MAQTTAKTVEDALRWIETTPHHFGSLIEEPGFLILKGYSQKLRIPEAIRPAFAKLIESGGRLDARMCRPNKAGRARLRRAALASPNSTQPTLKGE